MPIGLEQFYSAVGANVSRDQMMSLTGDYILDLNVYFYPINILYIIMSCVCTLTIVSVDIAFIIIIHHCLANFKIVSYRVRVSSQISDNINRTVQLKRAIRTHQNVLQMVDSIQNAYSFLFLALIGMTIIILSYCAVLILNTTDFGVILKYSVVAVGLVLHLFSLSWPGHQVIDHSSEIFYSTYECNWYRISKQNKNLLRFMMMRSSKPSVLTASGLYVMNYQNFGMVLKTAASYMAVITSMTHY